MRAFLSILVVLLLAGCNPTINQTKLLIGDSIMAWSVQEIHEEYLFRDNSPMLIFNAIPGAKTIDSGYWTGRIVQVQARVTVDTVIVNLGTNDASSLTPIPQVDDAIEDIMTVIDPGATVYWIEPFSSLSEPYRLAVVEAINDAALIWPNLVVLSFSDYLAGKGMTIPEVLGAGVHLSAQGSKLYADMLREWAI